MGPYEAGHGSTVSGSRRSRAKATRLTGLAPHPTAIAPAALPLASTLPRCFVRWEQSLFGSPLPSASGGGYSPGRPPWRARDPRGGVAFSRGCRPPPRPARSCRADLGTAPAPPWSRLRASSAGRDAPAPPLPASHRAVRSSARFPGGCSDCRRVREACGALARTSSGWGTPQVDCRSRRAAGRRTPPPRRPSGANRLHRQAG